MEKKIEFGNTVDAVFDGNNVVIDVMAAMRISYRRILLSMSL